MDNRLPLLQRISFEDLKSSDKMIDHSLKSDKIDILDNKSMNSSEQSLQSIPIQSFEADTDSTVDQMVDPMVDSKVVMFQMIDNC